MGIGGYDRPSDRRSNLWDSGIRRTFQLSLVDPVPFASGVSVLSSPVARQCELPAHDWRDRRYRALL